MKPNMMTVGDGLRSGNKVVQGSGTGLIMLKPIKLLCLDSFSYFCYCGLLMVSIA